MKYLIIAAVTFGWFSFDAECVPLFGKGGEVAKFCRKVEKESNRIGKQAEDKAQKFGNFLRNEVRPTIEQETRNGSKSLEGFVSKAGKDVEKTVGELFHGKDKEKETRTEDIKVWFQKTAFRRIKNVVCDIKSQISEGAREDIASDFADMSSYVEVTTSLLKKIRSQLVDDNLSNVDFFKRCESDRDVKNYQNYLEKLKNELKTEKGKLFEDDSEQKRRVLSLQLDIAEVGRLIEMYNLELEIEKRNWDNSDVSKLTDAQFKQEKKILDVEANLLKKEAYITYLKLEIGELTGEKTVSQLLHEMSEEVKTFGVDKLSEQVKIDNTETLLDIVEGEYDSDDF